MPFLLCFAPSTLRKLPLKHVRAAARACPSASSAPSATVPQTRRRSLTRDGAMAAVSAVQYVRQRRSALKSVPESPLPENCGRRTSRGQVAAPPSRKRSGRAFLSPVIVTVMSAFIYAFSSLTCPNKPVQFLGCSPMNRLYQKSIDLL